VPTDQCLEPDHLAIDLRQWLIVKTEFVPGDGGAEFVLDGTPLTQPIIHFDLEEARLAATGGLGTVERGIGIVEQRRRIGAVVRKDRNADTDADAQMLAINFQVGRDGIEQDSGNGFGDRWLVAVRRDENEFVAPEAGQERVAGEFSQHPRQFAQ
jgi:hypothetical protein